MILRMINESKFDLPQFKLDISNKAYDWELYYEQYKTTLCFLALNNTTIGMRFMSLLFVFRHTVELFLKRQIPTMEKTHSLKDLFDKIEGLPNDFLEQLDVLRCHGGGEDFRYIANKDGKPYFNGEVLQILRSLEYFFKLSNTDIVLENKPKGRFEIHTLPLRTMGHISTDYDESMCLILQGIIENKLTINDVYLPLLYIIRHSIELSLKHNLLDAGYKYLTYKSILKIRDEHSIGKLYNMFNQVIGAALDNIKEFGEKETKLRQETETFHKLFEELQGVIHNIDTNSFYFRFPVDRNCQPYNMTLDNNKLIMILKLRNKVDAYITFAVPLLQEYGYLVKDYE